MSVDINANKLPTVPDVNTNILALTNGALEDKLSELQGEKTKHKDSPLNLIKIEKQISEISSKIAEIEAERKKNSKKNSKSDDNKSSGALADNNAGATTNNSDDKTESSDAENTRDKILNLIAEGLKSKSIEKSENGQNVGTVSRETYSFRSIDTFNSFSKSIEELHNNLEGMGLDVRKAKVGEGGGTKPDSANFYAIRFPKEYKGNRDPMKITQDEINDIKDLYAKETPEQKASVDSCDYGIAGLGDPKVIADKSKVRNLFGLKKVEKKEEREEETDDNKKNMAEKILQQRKERLENSNPSR